MYVNATGCILAVISSEGFLYRRVSSMLNSWFKTYLGDVSILRTDLCILAVDSSDDAY